MTRVEANRKTRQRAREMVKPVEPTDPEQNPALRDALRWVRRVPRQEIRVMPWRLS